MRTVKHPELNKIIAGILAVTLALITSPAISACAHDGHSAELMATGPENSHHTPSHTTHADHHQMSEREAPSADCCETECQCISACSALLAVVGALPAVKFELLQPQFESLQSGNTQLFHTLPFRPPIQA